MGKRFGLKPTRFSTVLKKATGKTYIQFRNELRIEEARRLLITTDLSIKEIMHHVGYNDPSHFSRDFKRAIGVSPRQYRIDHFLKKE